MHAVPSKTPSVTSSIRPSVDVVDSPLPSLIGPSSSNTLPVRPTTAPLVPPPPRSSAGPPPPPDAAQKPSGVPSLKLSGPGFDSRPATAMPLSGPGVEDTARSSVSLALNRSEGPRREPAMLKKGASMGAPKLLTAQEPTTQLLEAYIPSQAAPVKMTTFSIDNAKTQVSALLCLPTNKACMHAARRWGAETGAYS